MSFVTAALKGVYACPLKKVRLCPGLVVLRQRRSFERARRSGAYFRCALVLLQAYRGAEDVSSEAVSYGITVSKKVGNAVSRNRVKRRLRAVLKSVLPQHAIPGTVYVVVARKELVMCPWKDIMQKIQEGVFFTNKRLQEKENEPTGC
ncbi:MAG: ribonuclease P protein component [Holosporales bacterium]|jgi:ribonuclease P protein component|nr:ribonuclease P protein component [Holosporales bacterium]